MFHKKWIFISTIATLSLFTILTLGRAEPNKDSLLEKAEHMGTVRVLVKLKLPFFESSKPRTAEEELVRRQEAIADVQHRVLKRMSVFKPANITQFKLSPKLAMEVPKEGLLDLFANPDVVNVVEDIPEAPTF